ncbi:MAG: single-stranded-DNA-specific exonuclease RecJ [Bacteroidetes bacterium]|nr:single-stranded-DNA-specific exonuclease RecJ [Bacteroidota bacterium]MDA0889264.1 single-stranded-DNA-specific exonuclease RecJ [Bacteroidota bacterium]
MRWKFKSTPTETTVAHLKSCLGVDDVIATLLAQRGIDTFEKAKAYFRPHLGQLHDPFLMQDMDKAVARLLHAIAQNETVMVYGDYDVDGTTSVSMLTHFLRSEGVPVTPYIPDRYAEGYGLSKQGIDAAKEANIKCIVALDCGVKAIAQAAYASSLDIDLIICDHHTPGESLPNALAVLDPKRSDCAYPYKELCGCGVGFKLMQAIAQKQVKDVDTLTAYLDFVAVAIAADIVPITEENRALAFLGLQQIQVASRPGLKAILRDKTTGQSISDVVFGAAPRINAAGRMKHGLHTVELLLSSSEDEAANIAEAIETFNTSRREVEQEITQEALAQIEANNETEKAASVVYASHWHKGVIGIVASRLIETYYRPTLVFTKASEGVLAASARSVRGYDVYAAIDACSAHLIQFGGHKYAAGVTIKESDYSAFKAAFEKHVKNTLVLDQKDPVLDVDVALPFSSITPKLLRILKQMEPCGPENRSPVFYSEGVLDNGTAKLVGKDNSHLKARFVQANSSPIDAIGFGLGAKMALLKSKKPLRIAYALEENHWQGNVSVQIRLKDIQEL